MAKFDEKLNRMNYLMEFRSPKSHINSSPVEFHTEGADGKVYGILREGSKYYIKTTTKGKEMVAESYDYVNGFNNKKDYEYNGYNEATKQLELKLMSLNEAYGANKKTSTVNFKKSKEDFSYLTEEARKELNRMNQIFENSGKIGKDNTSPVEYHGTANADNTTKNNAPFSQPAKAELDKDFKKTQTNPASATGQGYTNAPKDLNSDLQSDKMKGKGESGNQCFNKKVNDGDVDSEGEAIATKKPNGGKAVKMNESYGMGDGDLVGDGEDDDYSGNINYFDNDYADEDDFDNDEIDDDYDEERDYAFDDEYGGDSYDDFDDDGSRLIRFGDADFDEDDYLDSGDIGYQDFDDDEFDDDYFDDDDDDEYAGETDPNGSLFEGNASYGKTNMKNARRSIITGPEDSFDGPNTSDKKSNSIAYGEKRVGGDNGVMKEDYGSALPPDEKVMRGPKGNGKSIAYAEKRVGGDNGVMNESKLIESLVSEVYGKLLNENKAKRRTPKRRLVKESIQQKIQRIVNEEISRLDAWGKHPRYQKEPMQLPPNTEVMKGSADRDWNDNSAKGNAPYGRKIGSSAPFTQKVNAITNSVLQTLKESLHNRR